ncbi:MAG: pre-16S rRNA-processing nuclease YqgF [Armatimonadota bacterium]
MGEGAIVAVDPGRHRCGLAVVAPDGTVLARAIVHTSEVGARAAELGGRHDATTIVVGSRTGSRAVRAAVEAALPGATVVEVEEHMTTLQARRRYWREKPPRGLRRLVPEGLRLPPEPIDDWAAVILAERHLGLSGDG